LANGGMSRGRALLELTRPHNAALAALAALVGGVAAAGRDLNGAAVLLAMAAAAFGVAGGNALNDAHDARIDARAHPARPIPRGALTPADASWLGSNLLVLALAVGAAVNFWVLLLAGFLAGLLLLYELHFKARGLLGHVLVSYNTGALFLLGGLAALAPPLSYEPDHLVAIATDDRLLAPLVMALLAALLNLARELYKSAEDAPHDAGHRSTFAVRHGAHRARRLGDALAWITVPVALAPYALRLFDHVYALLLIPLLVLLLAVPFLDTPRTARAVLKIGMALGFLPFLGPHLI
jgi:geranylgeranylglycerol-phosphate geranylgeranyltransferase